MPFPDQLLQTRGEQVLKYATRYKQVAIRVGHPFQTFRDQRVYSYTGKYWVSIDDFDLKIFLREALGKMTNNMVEAITKGSGGRIVQAVSIYGDGIGGRAGQGENQLSERYA